VEQATAPTAPAAYAAGPDPLVKARPCPPDIAGYQRRLRAQRFDYRYWDASHDSLRHVLAGQRIDTQRLQTLLHLLDLTDLSQESLPTILQEHREALVLARQLRYPEQVPLRQLVVFDQLAPGLAHRFGAERRPV
jgi:hypothetical protein